MAISTEEEWGGRSRFGVSSRTQVATDNHACMTFKKSLHNACMATSLHRNCVAGPVSHQKLGASCAVAGLCEARCSSAEGKFPTFKVAKQVTQLRSCEAALASKRALCRCHVDNGEQAWSYLVYRPHLSLTNSYLCVSATECLTTRSALRPDFGRSSSAHFALS